VFTNYVHVHRLLYTLTKRLAKSQTNQLGIDLVEVNDEGRLYMLLNFTFWSRKQQIYRDFEKCHRAFQLTVSVSSV